MTMTQKTFRGVTLHGLPVQIELEWPFHASGGGSDWYVVHGRLALADGGPLHADIALNLSQTIKEVLPSLEDELAYWVAINTARKALDDKQLELLKSGKRQPVPVSSRSYSIRRKHFSFLQATPEQVAEFVARKVFWVAGVERNPVLIADPCDVQYLDATDDDHAGQAAGSGEGSGRARPDRAGGGRGASGGWVDGAGAGLSRRERPGAGATAVEARLRAGVSARLRNERNTLHRTGPGFVCPKLVSKSSCSRAPDSFDPPQRLTN